MSPAAYRDVRTELLPLRFFGPVADDTIAGAGQLTVKGAGTPVIRGDDGIQREITAVEVDPGGQGHLAKLAGNLDLDVVAVAVEQQRLLAQPTPRNPAGPRDPAVQSGLVGRVVFEQSPVPGFRDEGVVAQERRIFLEPLPPAKPFFLTDRGRRW